MSGSHLWLFKMSQPVSLSPSMWLFYNLIFRGKPYLSYFSVLGGISYYSPSPTISAYVRWIQYLEKSDFKQLPTHLVYLFRQFWCSRGNLIFFQIFLSSCRKQSDSFETLTRCTCSVASAVSDSLWPHGQPARLLCSWNSPGKNTRVGCH